MLITNPRAINAYNQEGLTPIAFNPRIHNRRDYQIYLTEFNDIKNAWRADFRLIQHLRRMRNNNATIILNTPHINTLKGRLYTRSTLFSSSQIYKKCGETLDWMDVNEVEHQNRKAARRRELATRSKIEIFINQILEWIKSFFN